MRTGTRIAPSTSPVCSAPPGSSPARVCTTARSSGSTGSRSTRARRRRRARGVGGSTTTEFVTTTRPPARPGAELSWPTYGYDNPRGRAVDVGGLRPPFRGEWIFHGHALLEFPPVVAYGRVYITN